MTGQGATEQERATFAAGVDVPWCNGCSYTQLNGKIQQVLAENYDPRDVVLVSDIGCIGIVDKLYTCHTVHGLHGRSVPLATGIKLLSDNPALKALVFIGDGGCSIGLQHLIEAARQNANMTVLSFDNQNYGMTGGQHSTFTLPDVKTVTTPMGSQVPAMDLVQMLSVFPATFRARLTANDKRVPETLAEAFAHEGFSYVETLNFCSSHVGRHNRDLALARAQEHAERFGRKFGVWPPTEDQPPQTFVPQHPAPQPLPVGDVAVTHHHALERPLKLVLGGSAGGGVQTAASLFTTAAARSGLHFSLKSDYPVTVGKGHSMVELILSPWPVRFSGIDQADVVLVVTADGRRVLGPFIANGRRVIHDAALGAEGGETEDFHAHTAKSAAFYALALMLRREGWFPMAALADTLADLPEGKVKTGLQGVLAELTD